MALRSSLCSSLRIGSRSTPFNSLRFSTAAPFRDVLRGEPSPKSHTAEPSNRPTQPQSSSPLSTSKPASAITPTLPVSSPTPKVLSYHVSRSRTRNLPVYKDWKAGGNLKQTRIRKIVGNPKTLSQDLAQELQIDQKLITVEKVTGHIVIKGHFKDKVEAFLKSKGF